MTTQRTEAAVSPEKKTSVPRTPQSLLVDWANQQDNWVRALVAEVITTRQELPEGRVQHFYEMLLQEKELSPGKIAPVPLLSGRANGLTAGEAFSLTALENTENINALTPAQRIQFNPCITLLFGENASGKTGYVRILKRAAAVRTAESVLPNVHAATTGRIPRAQLSYQLGGAAGSATWANDTGLHPFTRMDVFDSRCIQLHVDEDLTYIYTPGELSLFPLVQHGLEKVKSKLEAEIKRRTATTNPFLRDFDRASSLYAKIESLGAATNIQELRDLAKLNNEERAHVDSLKEEIAALRSQSPEAQARIAQREKQLMEVLRRTLRTIAACDLERYESARRELVRAREEYDRANRSAFAEVDAPGILQPPWKAFVEAGEELLAATSRLDYPSEGDECLYCRQELDKPAAELIRKYREFCSDQFQRAVTAAEDVLNGITGPLRQLELEPVAESVSAALAEAEGRAAAIMRTVAPLIAAAQTVQARLAAAEAVSDSELPARAAAAEKEVETHRLELEKLGTALRQRSDERQKALRERESGLLELSSRLRLADRLPDTEQYVSEAQWVNKAGICGKRFQTVFKSLTDASKSASDKLLNQNFERRFREECKKLRAPDVKLFFPGRQGQVARRKSVVPDHRLSEILSEGEQKVIALADFLAEVELKPKAPVILDDPVNSLDYRRIKELVDRIVELCRERQVVVFTHNIWFTTELLSRFDKAPTDCSYYDVQGDGARFGIITKGTHPRADNFKSLSSRLNILIQSAGKETGEPQLALVEKGYEYLRSICEVVVETELLQGVTQRYQPNVAMTKLPTIKFDRLREASESVFKVFEKCCRAIAAHSQPLETLNIRPTLSELKEDWKLVQDTREKYIGKAPGKK